MFRSSSKPTVRVEGIELSLDENLIKFEEFGVEFERQFHLRLKKMAYEGKEFWKTEAGKRLNSTKKGYQDSLVVADNGDETYTITLAGPGGRGTKEERWLAVAQEQGIAGFDMKPGLLKGRNIRRIRLADGNFRMVVPEAVGKWIHPGFAPLNIQEDVTKEITEVYVPKYMKEAFDAAMAVFNKGK